MVVILDTDHLTIIQRQSQPEYSRLRGRLAKVPRDSVCTTIINFEEQMRGWLSMIAASQRQSKQVAAYSQLQRLLEFFSQIPVLAYDEAAATRFEQLKRVHLRIGTMDLKIAALALTRDAVLLSRNIRDFANISSLKIHDWTGG